MLVAAAVNACFPFVTRSAGRYCLLFLKPGSLSVTLDLLVIISDGDLVFLPLGHCSLNSVSIPTLPSPFLPGLASPLKMCLLKGVIAFLWMDGSSAVSCFIYITNLKYKFLF